MMLIRMESSWGKQDLLIIILLLETEYIQMEAVGFTMLLVII